MLDAASKGSPSSGPTIYEVKDEPDTVSLGELADAFSVLPVLAQQSMDGETAAKVVRLNRWGNAYNLRYQKKRTAILEEMGEKVGEGKYQIKKEDIEKFNARYDALRAERVALDASLKISVSALSTLKLTPANLENLGAFLKDM